MTKDDEHLFPLYPDEEFDDATTFAKKSGQTIEWALDGRIPFGGVTMIAGSPKAGKSTAALHLARQMTRGGEWLGANTRKSLVAYAAFEGSRQGWAWRMNQLGLSIGDSFRFRLGSAPGPDEYAAWMEHVVNGLRPNVLFIDTLGRMIGQDDINSYGAITRAMAPFITSSREHHIATVLVHHTRKASQNDRENAPLGLDSVAGSQAFSASCDTVMLIRRSNDGVRFVRTFQRDGEEMDEERQLTWNAATLELGGHAMATRGHGA